MYSIGHGKRLDQPQPLSSIIHLHLSTHSVIHTCTERSYRLFKMVLTPHQKQRVAEAPASTRAAMRTAFNAQNAGNTKPAAPALRPQPKITAGNAARRSGGAPQRPSAPAKAVRIPNFLDPMSSMPVPSVTSDGMALPHTSLVSDDFKVGTVNTKVLVVSNVGNAGTVGIIYEVTPSGFLVAPAAEQTLLTIPTVSAADDAGGPSAGRAMKFSVSVVNCTNALKRGGRVTYLNSSQRLPTLGGTSVQWDLSPIINGIKSSPYRRRTMGDNLVAPKHLIGFPVDASSYARFNNWRGTLSTEEFNQHTLGASAVNPIGDALGISQRPMSVVAFIFDPTVDEQDYSVTIRASYYTRWPLDSVPGQSMKTIPTAPAAIINHISKEAEANANDLLHIGEGAAGATLGPRVAAALGGAARNAFTAMRGGGAALLEAGEGGLELGGAFLAANPELAAPLLMV
jgi:hypothetical protein